MERPELKQALGRLLGPAGPEVGCDVCFDELDRYVELEVAGGDADAADPRPARAPRRLPRLPRGAREPVRARQRRITAGAAGTSRERRLTANPQPQAATLTVTATGRGGERVLDPDRHQRRRRQRRIASFAVGTAITLRATNERDVIWSGACSSGGNKTKTCTFTLNRNASVTANVR